MLNHQPPPNWVAERAKCRVDILFEALCQVVERDVAEYNKLPARLPDGCTYSTESTVEGTMPILRVYHITDGKTDAVASFVQLEQGINVWVVEKGWLLAFPEWVEQTRSCLLSFGGNRYKVWELSQKVLGPLFF